MSLIGDLRVLYCLAVSPTRGTSHAERLESFYAGQARDYDRFRERLLPGRAELIRSLSLEPGMVWVDLGAGTGANLECVASSVPSMRNVFLVDLCPSLLQTARQRVRGHGWTNVEVVEADATTFRPAGQGADLVTLSYSLTMIPNWFEAVDNAWALLKPGGTVAVADFYVSRKFPPPGQARHRAFTRWFWRLWFSRDNVFLSPDHLAFLEHRFETLSRTEGVASIPYLPGARIPVYRYVGRKPEGAGPTPGPERSQPLHSCS